MWSNILKRIPLTQKRSGREEQKKMRQLEKNEMGNLKLMIILHVNGLNFLIKGKRLKCETQLNIICKRST